MLAIEAMKSLIEGSPFPHVAVNRVLAPDLFARLLKSYPVCPPASGPTGHTIHRGDAEFETVMAESPEWRDFFRYCNSIEFVRAMADLFAGEIDQSSCIVRDNIYFVDLIETREEKESDHIANPAFPAEAMFVRFDFMQGMDSYIRRAHLDHRRRLATLLIYFDSPGPDSFSGGDLFLHEKSGQAVRRIPPAANGAVFFPCSERSWHSVNAVTDCVSPRRFLQISVSSCHDIWPDGQGLFAKSLARGKGAVRKILAMAS